MLQSQKQSEDQWNLILEAKERSSPSFLPHKWKSWCKEKAIVVVTDQAISRGKSTSSSSHAVSKCPPGPDVWPDLIWAVHIHR